MKLAFVVVLFAALAGCGGSYQSTSTSTPVPNVALNGNYSLTAQSTAFPSATPATLGGFFTTNGTVVTGAGRILGSPCADFLTDVLSITGTVNGTAAKFQTIVLSSGEAIFFTGTASPDGKTLTGTYTTVGTCASGDSGIVNGFQVANLSGTYTGTLQPESPGLNPPVFTIALTEVDNTSGGIYNLGGTVTLTNSSCFQSATITSSTGFGASISLTFTADNGSTVDFAGNEDQTGKMISGTYNVTGGPCFGQSQPFSIARP